MNKVKVFLMVCCLGVSLGLRAQKVIDWETIKGVEYEKNDPRDLSKTGVFNPPTFDDSIKELDGQVIKIAGYFLSIPTEESVYILSKNPFASCFFCGEGGAETIMELHFKEDPDFKMDDLVFVTGKLKLNYTDSSHCYYILDVIDAFVLKM
ncbi:hypothetical protein MWU59_10800 [Flavobacteriaceae bacterium F08102]|nr:hypothetical protein [Flavobacteriaceae bacterium F08102]